MRTLTALALSTFCLAATSCGEPKRVVTAIAPPPERLQCAAAPARPNVPPEYKVDWTRALAAANVRDAVGLAMQEHMRFVQTLRTREGLVTGYIVAIEGQLFVCSNNAAWLRDWYKTIATP